MPFPDAGQARRRASVLLLVLWILIGAACMVYGAQSVDLARMRRARSRFEHAAAHWAARGAAYYGVGYLASFPTQPAQALLSNPPPAFPSAHRTDGPVGWFVARTPYPARPSDFGLRSEQARMPLSNLTPGAVHTLFGGKASAFTDLVNQRRANATAGQGTATQVNVFANPLELLAPPFGLDRQSWQGQDRNDNFITDPQEKTLPASTPLSGGSGVDRGLTDLVTAFTDGKFAAYDASDAACRVFVSDYPGMADQFAKYRSNETRPFPLEFLQVNRLPAAQAQAWGDLCQKALTNVSTFFRVEAWGTVGGEPVSHVVLICEARTSNDPTGAGRPWFRIVNWRVGR